MSKVCQRSVSTGENTIKQQSRLKKNFLLAGFNITADATVFELSRAGIPKNKENI